MATWPVSLPSYFMQGGYSEMLPKNIIKTKMEIGPPKMRRRSTTGPRPISGQLHMDAAQVVTFETFFESTLLSGSLRFDWVNPRTRTAKEFRFVDPPTYAAMGQDFVVSLKLEQMD
jgi:hypothetical protein